jgi:hypothetical protein
MKRELALARISVGDFFHASASNGASLLCLTMLVTATEIVARNIATQIVYRFDRRTGLAQWNSYGSVFHCTIDSVAPLPPDIHESLLNLDRKGREVEYQRAADPDWEVPPGSARLTDEQKRDLLFVSDFYPENPI